MILEHNAERLQEGQRVMNILFSAQTYICTYNCTLIVHYDNSRVLSCSVLFFFACVHSSVHTYLWCGMCVTGKVTAECCNSSDMSELQRRCWKNGNYITVCFVVYVAILHGCNVLKLNA